VEDRTVSAKVVLLYLSDDKGGCVHLPNDKRAWLLVRH